MNIAAIWMGLPQWARDAIKVAGIVLGVIFLGRQYVKGKQNEAVAANNAKRDREALEVEREVVSNIQENTNEVVREADAVRSHTAVVELPDGTKSLPEYHFRD
jgi:hypothetical protein